MLDPGSGRLSDDPGSPSNTMVAYYDLCTDNTTGIVYSISRMVGHLHPRWLGIFLADSARSDARRPARFTSDVLQRGLAFYRSSLHNMTNNIAKTITNQIRSNSGGDNFNATVTTGHANFDETYIHVRWLWMVLPLAEAILATVLLSLSIFITRGHPLLKTSVKCTAYALPL